MQPDDQLRRDITAVSLALASSGGLTVTDRSDLPRDQWQTWVLDTRLELAALDRIKAWINSRIELECAAGSTPPPKVR